jgi:thiamine biosynthesis lipoprotein
MKRSYKITACLLILLIVLLGAASCVPKPLTKFEETRDMMDTFVTITVYSDEKTAAEEAIGAAFARMEEVVKAASIFDEQAEAFQLNRDGHLDAASDDLLKLITMSLDYNQVTDGSFDITVQPLLDLWEGGLWKESAEVQQSRIDETMKLVGSDKIGIEGNKIYFKVEGMKITLGGIAKGYAVDEALKVLSSMGIKHALVNAGGDMATLGPKPNQEPWNIALANPDNTSQCLANLNVSDKAVCTSGNYERYFNPEKTVAHIIDPKTGYTANKCISVTIIAENCTQADALATGVFVMGPEDGMKLVESLDDVECLIVDNNRVIHYSSGLSNYLIQRQ